MPAPVAQLLRAGPELSELTMVRGISRSRSGYFLRAETMHGLRSDGVQVPGNGFTGGTVRVSD